MRPRTLARKKIKHVLYLFHEFGDRISSTGLSYQQNAIARAAWALEKNYEPYLVASAILYDVDELLAIAKTGTSILKTKTEKDKMASEFLKPIFDELISKPIRLKSVAQHYGNKTLELDSSTAILFEESPWFFSSMALFRLHNKLFTNTVPGFLLHGEIMEYEETLLSQTLILCKRDHEHA